MASPGTTPGPSPIEMHIELPPLLARRFETEVLPHLDVMYRMGMSLTRDPHRAEDLVHDAVLRAMRAFGKLSHDGNLRSWLVRVVHTTFLDQLRRDRRRPEESWGEIPEDSLSDGDEPESWEPAFLRDAFDDEIQGALGRLPLPWRSTLLLVDVEGWSYEEAAEATEVPVGTVRSRLHRARQRLYEHLRDRAPERPREGNEGRAHGDAI